ncbi:hypothetical protein [Mesorhizobium sp. M8A.F.Ca.ET.165.01.1.1]|uniref:hypothetical protein n=1 Tax=Mesorhizobium sp. M8A.F.Ca.ET.165.01.1.1 TaxID=2563960 RepID=UPI001093F4CA|nr:hypothetical protein [Mesorhizobium sp. M8A.F.Ca.ET.165.01.1.1]TGT42767.1 hypothetical protein EN808_12860 [Mesorhizobium sp. M8A.F.Ca.ET.165.01.1.1]
MFNTPMRFLKTVERFDIKQAANKLGLTEKELYNARQLGKDGGFIQRDRDTGRLYVLANEVVNLKEAMGRKAPSAVKHTQPPLTLPEIAAKTGIPMTVLYARFNRKRLHSVTWSASGLVETAPGAP